MLEGSGAWHGADRVEGEGVGGATCTDLEGLVEDVFQGQVSARSRLFRGKWMEMRFKRKVGG